MISMIDIETYIIHGCIYGWMLLYPIRVIMLNYQKMLFKNLQNAYIMVDSYESVLARFENKRTLYVYI